MLSHRVDTPLPGMFARQETFGYDDLDRLTTVHHGLPPGSLSMSYAANGNITGKTGLGEYSYGDGAGPHALTGVDDPDGLINSRTQTIEYNAFKKASVLIDTVGNDAYRLEIIYGPDGQRWKTALQKNGSVIKTVIFAGDYEKVTEDGVTRELIYLPGGGIYVRQAGQADKVYYAHTDHLGSTISITDGAGAEVFKASYDAWGKQTITNNTFKFHRGYTGHEHLPEFGLINMNARLYDPVIGRFLSPDPYVQAPEFSQSFNRYSYAWNNPLIYTDPDGESIILALAIISAWMGMGQAMISSDKSGWGLVGDMAKGFVVGAASGAVGAWAGGTVTGLLNFSGIAGGFLSGAAGGFAGGFVGGAGNAWAFGADFGQGLQAGLIGGGYGALAGGIIGGLLEGIQHQRQLIAFRKGNQSLGINESNPVPATDEFLSKAQKAWYKKAPMDKVKTFTVEKVPASIQNLLDGNKSPGLTRALSVKGNLTGYSNVYFNKNLAFLSAKDLFYTMGHEFVHVSQFAALAGQSANLLRQPGFIDMLEFHAYSYQNILGGTHLNSFTGADIINWQNTYPQFNSMGYLNFPWTFEHSFLYPF